MCPRGSFSGRDAAKDEAHIHIYAPPGARQLIRLCLRLCSISLTGSYAVHELLEQDQEPSVDCLGEELPVNEAVGENIRCDADGVWRGIVREGNGKNGRGWGVSAGPLDHRGTSFTILSYWGWGAAEYTGSQLSDMPRFGVMATARLNSSTLPGLCPPRTHPYITTRHRDPHPPTHIA